MHSWPNLFYSRINDGIESISFLNYMQHAFMGQCIKTPCVQIQSPVHRHHHHRRSSSRSLGQELQTLEHEIVGRHEQRFSEMAIEYDIPEGVEEHSGCQEHRGLPGLAEYDGQAWNYGCELASEG